MLIITRQHDWHTVRNEHGRVLCTGSHDTCLAFVCRMLAGGVRP